MLVLRPGALGDTLLAVPALRALRGRFSPLTLAAHGGAARLLVSVGEVDRGIAFDDPSLGRLFSGEPIAEDAIVAWMARDRLPAGQRALVVAPSRPAGTGLHCAQYLLDSVKHLGIDPVLDQRPLDVRPNASDDVLIHPGSGSAVKNWPAAQFAAMIEALEAPVKLIVGEADAQAAQAVEAALGRALPRLENIPLEALAGRLAGCRAYVGNDSGVSHLAGLCGARTIVLFGPTSPEVWRPLGPQVHVASFDTPPERVAALV
ncbi:MAG TPA: glycosyltransferase family 9 protein [Chloroflexota bacterium]|nr:glycosyltransferase family 9 protein [Chloroflexota bacterium]